jgi:ketosteroid isomerase-like protein
MRRTSLVTILVFVAGLGIGYFARSAMGTLERRRNAADLTAIEKLHQIDIEFTRSQDYKRLMDIWSEDAVRFMPGSPPDVGKQAILADNEKFAAEYPGFKVLSYAPEYKNIQIENGWACEWGEHESQYKLSPEAPPVSVRLKGFDVLRRQRDGSWKFAVLILNQN